MIEPTGGQFLNFFALHDAFPFPFNSNRIEEGLFEKSDFFSYLFDSSLYVDSDFNLFTTYMLIKR
jgi:hypothetical protein